MTRFLRLPPARRRLALTAWALLLLVRTALLMATFRRVYGLLNHFMKKFPIASADAPRNETMPDPHRICRTLHRVSRYVPGGRNCLARALSARFLLARHGYASELRIGVARNTRHDFEAHAWLEYQGRVLIGMVEEFERFKPFPSFEKGLP